MLEKCVLTILELNWKKRLGHKKTKLNICHHMLTSSTQLQNWSFHVIERTRTSTKCQKMKNARAKRANILFFIVKYANLWGFCCRRRRGCLSSLLFRALDDNFISPDDHGTFGSLIQRRRPRRAHSKTQVCVICNIKEFNFTPHIYQRLLYLLTNQIAHQGF